MKPPVEIELEDRLREELRQLERVDIPTYAAMRERAIRRRSSFALGLAGAAVLLIVVAAVAGYAWRQRGSDERSGAVATAGVANRTLQAPPASARWDLAYAISRRTGSSWTTSVYRLDPNAPSPVLLANVPASSDAPALFASPRGSLYAFAPERSYVFRLPARTQGANQPLYAPGSEGPRLAALSMAFADEHAYVSTSTQLVELVDSSDLAQFPSVRVIANVGGQLLGQLVDGRLLLASLTPSRALTFTAVGLDGRTEHVASVPDAAGSIAATGSTAALLRSRRTNESFAGDATLVNVDLVTGAETFNQPVGTLNNLTFAATHTGVGYIFTDPKAFFACCDYAGLVTFGARGSAGGNWSQDALTRHRLPLLEPRLSWSPDDRYIAFATGANYFGGVSYEVSPATPSAMGLAVYTRERGRILELEPQPDTSIRVMGWIARQ